MRIPTKGDVLRDKYRLEEVLGEGGFGVVFRATTELTGRRVAVKILKPSAGGYNHRRVQRFLREMSTIAKLESPHTLTLFDYGRTADGVPFMVCEYIEGEDLLTLMRRRGRLAEHEVVWILHQVLQSLEEAHRVGVLHRDIKPSNIRLFRYDKDPLRVKVLDFGLSRAIDAEEQTRLTGTNKVVGTPRYMAPEQLRGKPLSPASDLYALGLVAAELLLGRKSTRFRDLRPGQPVRLSAADPVSQPFRDVVNWMLAPSPEQRAQSAGALLDAIRPLRHQGPGPGVAEKPLTLKWFTRKSQTILPRRFVETDGARDWDDVLTTAVLAMVAFGLIAAAAWLLMRDANSALSQERTGGVLHQNVNQEMRCQRQSKAGQSSAYNCQAGSVAPFP